MAIAFGDKSTANNGAGGNITINAPAGVADGNAMYLHVVLQNGSATVTTPSGWTLDNGPTTNTVRSYLYRKVASSEPASYTITISSGTVEAVAEWAYWTGNDTTTMNDATTTSGTGTSATATIPSITTVTDNAVQVGFIAFTGGTSTPATGFVERWDSQGGGGVNTSTEGQDITRATAGATGTATSALAYGDTWVALSAAIRPAAGGGGGGSTGYMTTNTNYWGTP